MYIKGHTFGICMNMYTPTVFRHKATSADCHVFLWIKHIAHPRD